jgi:CO dehydrogenase maturation factor
VRARDILGGIKAEKVKIAVTGKGGVGKSTLAALMARVLKQAGNRVIVIDADPDMNMATLLGIPSERTITPIIELKELIAERTGTQPGEPAPFFTMNPKVDDIPEKYSVEREGIRLLVMGTVQRGGGGCACPENAFLKSLLGHLMITSREWVILDMEAGIEHLGRGTALGVDSMLVVVEPNRTSLETAFRIRRLAGDLGIRRVQVAGNKVRNADEERFIRENAGDLEIVGMVGASEEVRRISTGEASLFALEGRPLEQVKAIVGSLGAPVEVGA